MSLSLLILLFLTLAVVAQCQTDLLRRPLRRCPVGLTSVLIPQQVVRVRRCPERVLENIPPPGIDTQSAEAPATGSYSSIGPGAAAPVTDLSS